MLVTLSGILIDCNPDIENMPSDKVEIVDPCSKVTASRYKVPEKA